MLQSQHIETPHSKLGEGPVWDSQHGKLWWVDIAGKCICAYHMLTGRTERYPTPESPTAIALCKGGGELVVLMSKRLVRVSMSGERLQDLCSIEVNMPNNRTNDGKCDPAGRMWFGTMHQGAGEASGGLYRYTQGDTAAEQVLDGLVIANGMAWSLDQHTFFFTDSREQAIWAFDYDLRTGQISDRRTVVDVPSDMGLPDGMAIDLRDRLWVAHWGDACVRCWNPRNGALEAQINIGAQNATSCCFGGEGDSTLFITSAQDDSPDVLSESNHTPGGLFCAQAPLRGGAVYPFGPD